MTATTITSSIGNLHCNKRKFISDDDDYPPSARILSIANQIEVNCHTKRIKSIETERFPSLIAEVDDMMIWENDTRNKSQPVLIPKHCNGICNADASPTTFLIRCYCDPYRFNALIPYNSDVY